MSINFKQISLLSAFFALGVSACRKKENLYQIRISVTDANTAKVWKDTVGLTKNGGWEYGNDGNDRAHLGGVFVAKSIYQDNNSNNEITYYSSSLTADQVTAKLASNEESNKNDAVIKNFEIRYIDRKSKEVVILDKGRGLQVGQEYSKNFTLPYKAIFTIEARGEQTGETIAQPKPNWWAHTDRESFKHSDLKSKNSNNIIAQNGNNKAAIFEFGRQIGTVQEIASSFAKLTAQAYAIEGAGKRLSDAKVTLKIEVLKNGVVIASEQTTKEKFAQISLKGVAK